MRGFVKRYGANPLHLLVMLASLALAGYAAQRLLASRTLTVAVWFVGAAVLHDLLLVPLYSLADRPVADIWRRRRNGVLLPDRPTVPWLNHLRFPVAISLLLLLVYWPEISRRQTALTNVSHLSTRPYLDRWLLVTGILFVLSAVSYAVRLRRRRPA
jgi:hypothetical protein